MPRHRFAVLRAELGRELDKVRRLADEAREWQSRLADWPEAVRTRTAGGILHDFYSGIERIFSHIATRVDEDLPGGPDWHVQLLQRMATSVDAVRPALLDEETTRQLDRYLRFRHLFRHSYGFDLEWERCRELLEDVPATYQRLAERLAMFDEFLQTLERET